MGQGGEGWAERSPDVSTIELITTLYLVTGLCRKNQGNEVGGNLTEGTGNEVEVVRACDTKRGALRRKEGDGNGSTREKEEGKA